MIPDTAGFHHGELAVQRRAGVGDAAARLDGGAARFLARRRLAILTARDRDGLLWTSPLLGEPGFSGTATMEWTTPTEHDTGRHVHFHTTHTARTILR